MLRYIVLSSLAAFCVADIIEPGPQYRPSRGEPWPAPQEHVKNDTVFTLDPDFDVEVVGFNCLLLNSVIARYMNVVRLTRKLTEPRKNRSRRANHRRRVTRSKSSMTHLAVQLTESCEDYPYYGMDESYSLSVAAGSSLESPSIWGIMRGLQTFTHLMYLSDDYLEIKINATEIYDYPRFSHRGLLLDTSRHFISLQNILITLDAMEINKMNVFHWHIVDDQSFPYKSEKFPELSEQGAYDSTMVYTKEDIKHVVKYARDRGIRVLPELDAPGHTRALGMSHPEILTWCYSHEEPGLGPMNPIINDTYEFLGELVRELQGLFPDKFFHVGGDEVDLDCWYSNPKLREYMRRHNKNTKDLYAMFMSRFFLLLGKTQPIVWQEAFENGTPLSEDTPVQVWKSGRSIDNINTVLLAGHKVLFSTNWYLDHLESGGDWEKYYVDPMSMVTADTSAPLLANILGGEACMWTENVDDRNLVSRVWPRASAVAEMLWSSKFDLDEARNRLEEHTCRMIRRDVSAQPPNGPGFCLV